MFQNLSYTHRFISTEQNMLARHASKFLQQIARSGRCGGRCAGAVSLDGGCGDCDCGMNGRHVCGQQKRTMAGSPFAGASETIDGSIPMEKDHATGARREEHDDAMLGRERFNRSALYVDTMGTAADPTLVPSMEDMRVVGHMCDRFGANLITWMAVKQGEKTQCPDCGHVFKLDKGLAAEPLAAY